MNSSQHITHPLVSVTIPSYNSAQTLAETLDSVLLQTYPNIEVIVVDDGSTDDTQTLLSQYTSKIVSIRQNNGGLASARNAGCRLAQGKYIALMDADDLCAPERISVQVAYMEQYPEIVMCSSDFSAFNSRGLIADSFIANYYSQIRETAGGLAGVYPHHEELILSGYGLSVYSGYVYEKLALGNFIHPPTVLIRRNILDKSGFVDDRIVNCCDFDWFVRISRFGEIGFIDRPLLKYRLSENQMSGSGNWIQISHDIIQVVEKTILADPALFKRNRKQFRRYLGNAYLNAADSVVARQSIAAVKKLVRSIMFGTLRLRSFKVLIKALTPKWLFKFKRSLRKR